MRNALVRTLWLTAAAFGVGAGIHTLAQDTQPDLPPVAPPAPQLPPLPPAARPVAPRPVPPATPATPPTQTAPLPTPVTPGPVPPSPAPPLPGVPQTEAPAPAYGRVPGYRGYQPDQGVDPSLYYVDGGMFGGRYPQPVGSPYYHSPTWRYTGGNAYDTHFGPGFYRSGEYGHLRFPYYSYRHPWYHPGPAVYVRDTNLHW